MKNIKNTKGITLIALVVTIVVLLILAAVSINMLKGENGIIARATEAREKNKYASAKEKVDMAKMASLDSTGEVDKDKLVDELNKVGTVESENWPVIANVDGYVFSIDEDGNIGSPKSYNITYALNGGTNADGNPTTYTGLEDVFLKYPTKDGSAFDGWYYEGNFSGERISKIDKTKGDVTVYAKWQEETNDDYFTWIESNDYAVLDTFSDLGLEKYNAGELKKIIIPKKHNGLDVTQIDNWAFIDKNLINEVFIPDCVRTIGLSAFKNCTELEKITYPISVDIGNRSASSQIEAFGGCSKVKTVNFTKGTGIGYDYSAAYGGGRYTTPWYYSRNNDIKITFEEGITQIGNNMFIECTGLKFNTSNLPRSLTRIGEYAFYKCSGITGDMDLPKKLNEVGSNAFYECTGLTGNINLPDSLVNIGTSAFFGCTGITGKIIFSDEVKELGNSVFENCKEIKEVVIHDGFERIASRAFAGCTGIEKITVPISLRIGQVTNYSENASFNGCTGVKEMYFTKGTGIGVEYANSYTNSVDSYYTTPWYCSKNNEIKITFEEGITEIGNSMFYECTGLKCDASNLPRSITKIGEYAFYKCSGLTGDINLPRNLNELGSNAFYECTGLTGDINLPDSLVNIGTAAFYDCTGITGKIEFSDEVKEIGNSVFENCKEIKEVVIHDRFERIGSRAFAGCTGIEKITVPISLRIGKVTNYSENASFNWCTGVKEMYFTKGTGIGVEYANSYTNSIDSYYTTPWYCSKSNDIKITFEEGITKIGNNTFYEQTKATFYFDGTADQWSGVTIGTGNEALSNINFLK